MVKCEFLIVGAGVTGAAVARQLRDAGRDVLVIDRRDEPGGNCADFAHEPSGVRMNRYGPHYFRTSSDRVWEYARRFASFRPYEARVLTTAADGELVPWPLTKSYVVRRCGRGWEARLRKVPHFYADRNFETITLSRIPTLIYEEFVKPYTEKQWGVPAHELKASLAARFRCGTDDDDRLTPNAKYQGLPIGGYSKWVGSMLDGIECAYGVDYAREYEEWPATRVVYTGPLDHLCQKSHGPLEYRGQKRTTATCKASGMAAAQVNEPAADRSRVRRVDWSKVYGPGNGTVVTTETPQWSDCLDSREYPFPSGRNHDLQMTYAALAKERFPNLTPAGRLGTSKYLDMDQAIAAALTLADRLLAG